MLAVYDESVAALDGSHLFSFIREAVHFSLRCPREEHGVGNPCGYLIERCSVIGIDAFIERKFSGQDSGELRLNGAGFKLYWSIERDRAGRNRLCIRIGGDQFNTYPVTGARLRVLVKQFELDRNRLS